MSIEKRLADLGIEIPTPTAPVANYVPFVQSGKLDDARAAARLCALNIIAQAKAACDGDLDRVVRIVKLGGFVNCVDGFGSQQQVINAASDLMVEVFGDKGKHSRSAVGTNALPLNVPVEIDALIEIG